MLHNADSYTRLYNTPHFNSLTSESPNSDQPLAIKTGLRPHQKAVIQRMVDLETNLIHGYDICGEQMYSRFGILGDSVGVGKSLMVLGHIARMKNEPKSNFFQALNQMSNRNMYSLIQKNYTDLSNCPALLVVPHTLFRQWQGYIEAQTTLKPFLIKSRKSLSQNIFKQLTECDFVLISNTLLGSLLEACKDSIWFSRTYIDEADSIHITSTKPFPPTTFLWFISATWQNLIFENDRVWLSHGSVQRITSSPEFSRYDTAFQAQMINSLVGARGFFDRYACASPLYFKDYLRTQHPYRSQIVIKCSDEFIQQSISLPPLFTQVIHCEPSVSQRIIGTAISNNIQNLLHAGDVQAALNALGVPTESPLSLIQAVTENRMKELDRLEKTHEFKSKIEYSTPQLKEQALANLQVKITSLKEQIDAIRQRIENYKKEICAICFDEPSQAVLTPCCSRIICASCIIISLSRIAGCPMCRAPISPNKLRSVNEAQPEKKKVQEVVKGPPKKIDALFDLIQKNPKDKFLIFSRYENPFRMMQERLEAGNIQVQTVKGNKDVINSLLHKFENGDVRVLLLNSNHAGAGLNITSATYVVLWHAMTPGRRKADFRTGLQNGT